MTDFADLQALVRSYMHRTDLDTDIPEFIDLARKRMNRDMRSETMFGQVIFTSTSNPEPTPDDFLEFRDMFYETQGVRVSLKLAGRSQIDLFSGSNVSLAATNAPSFVSFDGNQISTAPGGEGLEYTLLYYQEITELVNDTDTNPVLDKNTTIWLYGSLIEGHSFTQDLDLMNKAIEMYSNEVGAENQRAKERIGGAGLTMQGASSWV